MKAMKKVAVTAAVLATTGCTGVTAAEIPGYQTYDNNDLPYLVASTESIPLPASTGPDYCARKCDEAGDSCTGFVFYGNSCTFRDQSPKEIEEGMSGTDRVSVFIKSADRLPEFWFHSHSDSLKYLQDLMTSKKISATDPNAMKLYKSLTDKAAVSMSEGWFSWIWRILFSSVTTLVFFMGAGFALFFVYKKYGESCRNFVYYKVIPAKWRKQENLNWDWDDDAAMYDFPDGL